MRPFYLSPSEAVVLRHALMSYRNRLSEQGLGPYPMSDGFELVAADTMVARLDGLSEELLTEDRRRASIGKEPDDLTREP